MTVALPSAGPVPVNWRSDVNGTPGHARPDSPEPPPPAATAPATDSRDRRRACRAGARLARPPRTGCTCRRRTRRRPARRNRAHDDSRARRDTLRSGEAIRGARDNRAERADATRRRPAEPDLGNASGGMHAGRDRGGSRGSLSRGAADRPSCGGDRDRGRRRYRSSARAGTARSTSRSGTSTPSRRRGSLLQRRTARGSSGMRPRRTPPISNSPSIRRPRSRHAGCS